MKKMKLVIAAAAVLAVYAGLAQIATAEVSPAKNPQRENVICRYAAGKPMNADYRLEMMANRLGLSEDQKAKIKPILEENYKQKQAVRADKNLTRDQRRVKMQELRAKLHDQIKPLLTPEQNSKAADMWTATGQHWKERKGHGKPGHYGKHFRMNPDAHLARMTSCLGLSVDQQAKIKPILEENFTQKKAAHADKNLTRDQRRAKMQELRVQLHEKVKPLLTQEQLKQYEAWKGAATHHPKCWNFPLMK